MSYYMVFNSWSGDDSAAAIEKMSRVFRLDEDHASKILDDLTAGETWQFEHQVSDKQSEIAESYLQGLGFDMEPSPIHGPVPEPFPAPDSLPPEFFCGHRPPSPQSAFSIRDQV